MIIYINIVLWTSFISVCVQSYIDSKFSIEMRNKKIELHDIRDVLPYRYTIPLKLTMEVMCFTMPILTVLVASKKDISLLCVTWSILQLLRVLCFSVTILPPPSPYHHPFYFTGGSCDAIYSGHTMVVVLNCLILMKYYNPYILWIFSIVYSFMVLLTRSHYTVDIILAYIITISVYYNIRDIDLNYIFN